MITVPYERLSGYPREQRERGRLVATDRLICNWEDRHELANEILGLTWPLRQAPQSYRADFPFCMARRVAIEPMGELVRDTDGHGRNTYERAILTVEYETPSGGAVQRIAPDEQTIIEEELYPSAQVLMAPAHGLYWDDARTIPFTDAEAPLLTLRQLDWQVTVYGMPVVPAVAIDYMNCVNDSAVVSPTLGVVFEAETVLFHGARPSRIWTTGGAQPWKVVFPFTIKPSGWNRFYRRGAAVPAVVYDAAGEPWTPYEPVDFRQLGFWPVE